MPDRDLGPSMVLPTRDRGTGSATATAIAILEGEEVYAPIIGTAIADTPNRLPFSSQIDHLVTETGRALPHTHLEIQRL